MLYESASTLIVDTTLVRRFVPAGALLFIYNGKPGVVYLKNSGTETATTLSTRIDWLRGKSLCMGQCTRKSLSTEKYGMAWRLFFKCLSRKSWISPTN